MCAILREQYYKWCGKNCEQFVSISTRKMAYTRVRGRKREDVKNVVVYYKFQSHPHFMRRHHRHNVMFSYQNVCTHTNTHILFPQAQITGWKLSIFYDVYVHYIYRVDSIWKCSWHLKWAYSNSILMHSRLNTAATDDAFFFFSLVHNMRQCTLHLFRTSSRSPKLNQNGQQQKWANFNIQIGLLWYCSACES